MYGLNRKVIDMGKKRIPQNDFSKLCMQVNEMERVLDELYDRIRELEDKHKKDIDSIIDTYM